MEDFINFMNSIVGRFVCDDGGIYKGQCPQLPRYVVVQMGCPWPGRTGNGNKVIDTMVNEYGGYYGQGKYGYRIASADSSVDKNGHCWIEVLENGRWVRYEQNVNNSGAKTANFGCGTVYSVTKTDKAVPSYLYNIRYASHPSIDYYIEVHSKPKPEPTPEPEGMPDWFKNWAKDLSNYIANSTKEDK